MPDQKTTTTGPKDLVRAIEPPDYAEKDFGAGTSLLAAYRVGFFDARQEAVTALAEQDQPALSLGRELEGPIKRLERIRDIDEQTSDGALGSLARYALDELADLEEAVKKLKTIGGLLAMAAPAVFKARSTGQPGLDAALMTVMDAADIAASLSASSETGGAGGTELEVLRQDWTAQNSRGHWEPVDRAPTAEEIAAATHDGYFWHEAGKVHGNRSAGPAGTLYRIPQQSVPDSGERLTLKVVVSGAPFEVGINRVQPIAALIDSALLGAGIKRRVDIGTWHVRTEQGVILESLAAVQDGATLFLDPEAGGGASEVESEQISGSQDAEPPKNDPSPAESARIEAPQPDPPGEVPGREGGDRG